MDGSPALDIWVVRAGTAGKYASEFEERDLVGIGTVVPHSLASLSSDEIKERLKNQSDGDSRRTIAGRAGQLFRFAHDIDVGDLVITPDAGTRELLFGRVTSPYEFHETPIVGGFFHYRKVEWLGRRSRDLLPKRVLYSLGSLATVFQPGWPRELTALVNNQPVPESDEGTVGAVDVGDSGAEDNLLADLQSRSEELISAKIAHLDAYEMQDLVAGVLQAMGFHTQVSPPGTDQGVDIVASRDPLGLEQPVKVQVKARPNTKTGAPEVAQLAGNVGTGERGMFVSTGGFTKEVAFHPSSQRLVLIDGDRLRSLVVEYYDRLESDAQALVPLRRVYFPSD
ncbi:MAG: restriction endonuclease [Actinomycetota bacterium]